MLPPSLAPRTARRALLATVGLLAVVLVALMLLVIAQAGRAMPGTTVLETDVGDRDVWAVRRVLGPELRRAELRPLGVSLPGERILVRPADLGLTFDVEETVAAVMSRGRTGMSAPIVRLVAPIGVAVPGASLTPRGAVDEKVLAAWVDELADRVDRGVSVGDLAVDVDTRSVVTVAPRGALRVDRPASVEALRTALLDPKVKRVSLVTELTLPPSTLPAVEALATSLRRSLERPIVLEHEGRQLVVPAETLAELVTVRTRTTERGAEPALLIPAERVQRALGEEARQVFNREAVDAVIVTPATPPTTFTDLSSTRFVPVPADVEVVPGATRVTFIARRAARQLVGMVLAGERSAEADLLIVEPDLPTERALAGSPTHLVGTFTTIHPAGAPRTVKIRLLADMLDDIRIAPGEEFSVNATSGPRLCTDGFIPAGTIVRGELVDTCGGGVSQFGTTLMNAVFFAGLPLEQWQPHSFFISRYPAGREATLSYPELDVRFRNDTDGFVVLRTSHTPDSITVSLYGVPRWAEVRADHGARRAPTDFSETVRGTTSLRPGARRVVQSGGGGFTIGVARTLVPADSDATPTVERWTTVYRPQQRIVEVGVAPSSDAVPDAAAPPAVDGAGSAG